MATFILFDGNLISLSLLFDTLIRGLPVVHTGTHTFRFLISGNTNVESRDIDGVDVDDGKKGSGSF